MVLLVCGKQATNHLQFQLGNSQPIEINIHHVRRHHIFLFFCSNISIFNAPIYSVLLYN